MSDDVKSVDSRPNGHETADHELFNRIAHKYAHKDIVKSSAVCRKYQLIYALKPVLKPDYQSGVIVDIACGVGAPAAYIKNYYSEYIGIDYSEEMINAARIFNKDVKNTRFVCSNIKNIESPDVRADVIMAVGAFHHMTELDKVFNSLKAIAKPEAYLVAIEPQRANPLVQIMRWIRGKIDKSYSEEQHYFSRSELYNILKDNGMIDVETEYQGYFTPPLAQVILNPQFIFYPLAILCVQIDKCLDRFLPGFMKFLSWNIVIRAKFPGVNKDG